MILSNVCKSFQDNDVLKGVSLELEHGIAHGLLGANGAGKSTLIKSLMNLIFIDSGQIIKPDNISLLSENPYLPISLTAFQIISYACRIHRESSPEGLLEEVKLKKSAWHQPIQSYSKGMKQRTSIAFALAGKPNWLILDEPMSGLDAMGRTQMLQVFEKRKQQGVSLLMCSHAITDLVRLCEKIHIMADGKICEMFVVKDHSMEEVQELEEKLKQWSGEHVID